MRTFINILNVKNMLLKQERLNIREKSREEKRVMNI